MSDALSDNNLAHGKTDEDTTQSIVTAGFTTSSPDLLVEATVGRDAVKSCIPRGMRAAVYARVSTLDKGQTVENQLLQLREYCDRRGLGIVEEYCDTGISGSKEKRPALDRLMRDARLRVFDVLVVWRFDRFSRSVKHLIQSLEEFQALGVNFVSLSEAVDTSTPMGKMIFTVLGAVAELERNMIRERVIAGMDRARKQGKTIGGRKRRIFDRDKARAMRKDGMSLRQIARELGVNKDTIAAAL